MKKYNLIFLFFSVVLINNYAQQDCRNIGMNLYFNKYWSREMPFADLTKQASQWLDVDLMPILLDDSDFDTTTGYPLAVPLIHRSEATILKRIVCLDNGGIHPSGDYTLTYEGKGNVSIVGEDVDAETVISPNKKIYTIQPKDKGEIILVIHQSEKDDPIRNISFMLPGTNKDSDLFNPAFLEKLSPFTTIRFLNWTETNYNPTTTWSERVLPIYYDQTSIKGVAYEYIIALCNTLKKNMWLNTPHAANDEFISKLAQLMDQHLNPEIHTYLEYSNEVWNTNHAAYQWVSEQGSSLHSDHQYQYAYFSGKMFKTYQQNFKRHKLTRVLCGQQAWSDVLFRSAKGMEYFDFENDYDALSCTGNIYLSDADQVTVRNLGNSLKPEDVIAMLRKNLNTSIKSNMAKHYEISANFGKSLVTYESNPYALVQYPQFGTPPPYAQGIYGSIYDAMMKELYTEWIQTLFESYNVDLMMAFVLADDNMSHYGSFGHLDHVFQKAPYNPAYQALLDARCISTLKDSDQAPTDLVIFPNPSINTCIVSVSQPLDEIAIYDVAGRLVATKHNLNGHNQELDLRQFYSGVYFVKVHLQNGSVITTKLVIQ